MSNPSQGQAMNAPVWNANTTVQTVVLTGGFDTVSTTGFYIIISNTGANNIWVGPDAVSQGIQVAPGESLEFAISSVSPLFFVGTAAQTVSVVEFSS